MSSRVGTPAAASRGTPQRSTSYMVSAASLVQVKQENPAQTGQASGVSYCAFYVCNQRIHGVDVYATMLQNGELHFTYCNGDHDKAHAIWDELCKHAGTCRDKNAMIDYAKLVAYYHIAMIAIITGCPVSSIQAISISPREHGTRLTICAQSATSLSMCMAMYSAHNTFEWPSPENYEQHRAQIEHLHTRSGVERARRFILEHWTIKSPRDRSNVEDVAREIVRVSAVYLICPFKKDTSVIHTREENSLQKLVEQLTWTDSSLKAEIKKVVSYIDVFVGQITKQTGVKPGESVSRNALVNVYEHI